MISTADTDQLADAIDITQADGVSWLTAAIILGGGVAAAIAVRFAINRLLSRRIDRALSALISRTAGYVIAVLAGVAALDVVGVKVGPLIGALGIAGIAVAFALRDILENFVAGIMLQLSRPFTYGDEVSINSHVGVVTDISSRVVTMETPDGETVLVPSATVIKTDVINRTRRGGRRTDLAIGVEYGTGIGTARGVLRGALDDVPGVRPKPEPQVLFVGFGDSSVDFVVRYWHDPAEAQFWVVRDRVGEAVETALNDAGIGIPFPQLTMWRGDAESSAD